MNKVLKKAGLGLAGVGATVATLIGGPMVLTTAAQSASAPAVVKVAAQEFGTSQANAAGPGKCWCRWEWGIQYTVKIGNYYHNKWGPVYRCGCNGNGGL